MAIHSKFVDLVKAAALSVSWSAVLLFFEGLLWRFLFLLGDLFIYLGNAMHSFGDIARGPPLPPADEGSRKRPERSPMGMDAMHSFGDIARGPPMPSPMPPADESLRRRPERSPMGMDADAPTVGTVANAGYPQHSTAGMAPDLKWSKVTHEVQERLPKFLCNVDCHRPWHKWYAIVIGRQPGLYNCWDCAEDMVTELRGNKHKSFRRKLDAERFLRKEWHCLNNH